MGQITKKLFKVLLSVIMCFSVLHIPNLGTVVKADTPENEPPHNKSLSDNPDGTWTISLDVLGDSESADNNS